jgi:hypothetical protein
MRDLHAVPPQSFREWWRERQRQGTGAVPDRGADSAGPVGSGNTQRTGAVGGER